MRRILNAIAKDLEICNYYSALYVGLSLIDACAKIEYKGQSTPNRCFYVDWLNKYYVPLYEINFDDQILPATAIYQLRCSVVHESTNLINKYNVLKHKDISNLYRIILTVTPSHRNRALVSDRNNTIDEIQLNIVSFIEEITSSICNWMENRLENEYQLNFSILENNWSTENIGSAVGFNECH